MTDAEALEWLRRYNAQSHVHPIVEPAVTARRLYPEGGVLHDRLVRSLMGSLVTLATHHPHDGSVAGVADGSTD